MDPIALGSAYYPSIAAPSLSDNSTPPRQISPSQSATLLATPSDLMPPESLYGCESSLVFLSEAFDQATVSQPAIADDTTLLYHHEHQTSYSYPPSSIKSLSGHQPLPLSSPEGFNMSQAGAFHDASSLQELHHNDMRSGSRPGSGIPITPTFAHATMSSGLTPRALKEAADADQVERNLALFTQYHQDNQDDSRRASTDSAVSASTTHSSSTGFSSVHPDGMLGHGADYRQQYTASTDVSGCDDAVDYFHPSPAISAPSHFHKAPCPVKFETSSIDFHTASNLHSHPAQLHTPAIARYACPHDDCQFATDRRDLARHHHQEHERHAYMVRQASTGITPVMQDLSIMSHYPESQYTMSSQPQYFRSPHFTTHQPHDMQRRHSTAPKASIAPYTPIFTQSAAFSPYQQLHRSLPANAASPAEALLAARGPPYTQPMLSRTQMTSSGQIPGSKDAPYLIYPDGRPGLLQAMDQQHRHVLPHQLPVMPHSIHSDTNMVTAQGVAPDAIHPSPPTATHSVGSLSQATSGEPKVPRIMSRRVSEGDALLRLRPYPHLNSFISTQSTASLDSVAEEAEPPTARPTFTNACSVSPEKASQFLQASPGGMMTDQGELWSPFSHRPMHYGQPWSTIQHDRQLEDTVTGSAGTYSDQTAFSQSPITPGDVTLPLDAMSPAKVDKRRLSEAIHAANQAFHRAMNGDSSEGSTYDTAAQSLLGLNLTMESFNNAATDNSLGLGLMDSTGSNSKESAVGAMRRNTLTRSKTAGHPYGGVLPHTVSPNAQPPSSPLTEQAGDDFDEGDEGDDPDFNPYSSTNSSTRNMHRSTSSAGTSMNRSTSSGRPKRKSNVRSSPSVNKTTNPDDKLFMCEYAGCEKAFKRSEHKRRHERSHTQEKPYVCDVPDCGKKFSRSDNLSAHKKTHNKDGRTTKIMNERQKAKLEAAGQ